LDLNKSQNYFLLKEYLI